MVAELHRRRARYAYLQVESWGAATFEREAVETWLPGLPVLIRSQGLLVAMCLLKKAGAARLASAFEDWVLGTAQGAQGLPKLFGDRPRGGLVRLCAEASRPTYQAAQREALALAEMLKLMADAHWPKARS